MEIVCSSETSVNFYRTTRLYIPEIVALTVIALIVPVPRVLQN
jgi:hypothetical protein